MTLWERFKIGLTYLGLFLVGDALIVAFLGWEAAIAAAILTAGAVVMVWGETPKQP